MWADTYDEERFVRAVARAASLHRGQLRKGTGVPYLSHLLAVASLVAEDGGSEDEVIAALLHDSAEDQGGEAILEQLRGEFGDAVADIVRDCSDSLLHKGQEKSPWRERKRAAVERMGALPPGSLRVIAADKLHNTRATAADLQLVGSSVWERFKTGRNGFLWYHQAVLEQLSRLLPQSRSVLLLGRELEALAQAPA